MLFRTSSLWSHELRLKFTKRSSFSAETSYPFDSTASSTLGMHSQLIPVTAPDDSVDVEEDVVGELVAFGKLTTGFSDRRLSIETTL